MQAPRRLILIAGIGCKDSGYLFVGTVDRLWSHYAWQAAFRIRKRRRLNGKYFNRAMIASEPCFTMEQYTRENFADKFREIFPPYIQPCGNFVTSCVASFDAWRHHVLSPRLIICTHDTLCVRTVIWITLYASCTLCITNILQVNPKRTNRPGLSTTARGRGRGRGRGMFYPRGGGGFFFPMFMPMRGRGRAMRYVHEFLVQWLSYQSLTPRIAHTLLAWF